MQSGWLVACDTTAVSVYKYSFRFPEPIEQSVTFGLAGFGLGQDAAEAYISYMTTISSTSTFLIAGGLAYFFSRTPS